MKYESLKNKKYKLIKTNLKKENTEFSTGFEKGVDESFNLFVSYINLYNKYKNDVKLLMQEQKDVWKEWVKFYENQNNLNKSNYLEKYNFWLFDFIFSNITEKESDNFFTL
jgi:hypothetical protein